MDSHMEQTLSDRYASCLMCERKTWTVTLFGDVVCPACEQRYRRLAEHLRRESIGGPEDGAELTRRFRRHQFSDGKADEMDRWQIQACYE